MKTIMALGAVLLAVATSSPAFAETDTGLGGYFHHIGTTPPKPNWVPLEPPKPVSSVDKLDVKIMPAPVKDYSLGVDTDLSKHFEDMLNRSDQARIEAGGNQLTPLPRPSNTVGATKPPRPSDADGPFTYPPDFALPVTVRPPFMPQFEANAYGGSFGTGRPLAFDDAYPVLGSPILF